jgi:phosphodiesterase/alkaline phosphatase D-like protein
MQRKRYWKSFSYLYYILKPKLHVLMKRTIIIIIFIVLTLILTAGIVATSSYYKKFTQYSAYAAEQANRDLFITHGVSSGDVTDHSAVIWARANKQAQMYIEYDNDPNFSHPKSRTGALANQSTDFTAHIKLEGLSPDDDITIEYGLALQLMMVVVVVTTRAARMILLWFQIVCWAPS